MPGQKRLPPRVLSYLSGWPASQRHDPNVTLVVLAIRIRNLLLIKRYAEVFRITLGRIKTRQRSRYTRVDVYHEKIRPALKVNSAAIARPQLQKRAESHVFESRQKLNLAAETQAGPDPHLISTI